MRRCIILGDSISEGIGSKKLNYLEDLSDFTNGQYEFINFAKTGTTIEYAEKRLDEILHLKPDIAIIMYGSVDAQIRANIDGTRFGINKFIPKRYKIGGMLEPRAFNSKKPIRKLLNALDNGVRFVLKKTVLFTQGTVQWVDIDTFDARYRKVIESLNSNNIKLLLVSTIYLDDNYFLNSSMEYEKFNEKIKAISKEYGAIYLDLYTRLKKSVQDYGWDEYYSHDHFHPNREGYRFYAECLSKALGDIQMREVS